MRSVCCLLALAWSGTACGLLTGPTDCTAEARFALTVAVSNGLTGEPVFDALVTARDGSFVDSVRTADRATVGLAPERPGTYDVTVQKAGFLTFERRGIEVQADECHVITERVDAELIPE